MYLHVDNVELALRATNAAVYGANVHDLIQATRLCHIQESFLFSLTDLDSS